MRWDNYEVPEIDTPQKLKDFANLASLKLFGEKVDQLTLDHFPELEPDPLAPDGWKAQRFYLPHWDKRYSCQEQYETLDRSHQEQLDKIRNYAWNLARTWANKFEIQNSNSSGTRADLHNNRRQFFLNPIFKNTLAKRYGILRMASEDSTFQPNDLNHPVVKILNEMKDPTSKTGLPKI